MERASTRQDCLPRIRTLKGALGLYTYGLGVIDAVWGREYATDIAELDQAEMVLAHRKTPEAQQLFNSRVRSLAQKWEVPDEDGLCVEQDMQRAGSSAQIEAKEDTPLPPEEDVRELLGEIDQIVANRWKQNPSTTPPIQGGGDGLPEEDLDAWVESLFRAGEGFFRDHGPTCACEGCSRVRQILGKRKERADLEEEGYIFSTREISDETVPGDADIVADASAIVEHRFAHPEEELTAPDPATENTPIVIENPDRLLTDNLYQKPQPKSSYSAEGRPLEAEDERWLKLMAVATYGRWIRRPGIERALGGEGNIQQEVNAVLDGLTKTSPSLAQTVFPDNHVRCGCARCRRAEAERVRTEKEMRGEEDVIILPTDTPRIWSSEHPDTLDDTSLKHQK